MSFLRTRAPAPPAVPWVSCARRRAWVQVLAARAYGTSSRGGRRRRPSPVPEALGPGPPRCAREGKPQDRRVRCDAWCWLSTASLAPWFARPMSRHRGSRERAGVVAAASGQLLFRPAVGAATCWPEGSADASMTVGPFSDAPRDIWWSGRTSRSSALLRPAATPWVTCRNSGQTSSRLTSASWRERLRHGELASQQWRARASRPSPP
jgi:hypothetical protein